MKRLMLTYILMTLLLVADLTVMIVLIAMIPNIVKLIVGIVAFALIAAS